MSNHSGPATGLTGRRPAKKVTRGRKLRPAVILFLGAGLLAGCASQRSMYRGIEENRTRAYDAWLQAHRGEEATRPRAKGDLSLADALKLALTYNKSLQAVSREREIAQGGVTEAYSGVLPTVSGEAEYVRLDEAAEFDVGGQVISMGDANNYSAGLQVTQPLFRGGESAANWRAARWNALLADDRIREAVQDTIHQTAVAYYDTLLAQHLFEVNRAAVASARDYLSDVRIKYDQGIASQFDILRAEVDVSLFEAQMIQQQNQVNISKTKLLLAMGASQESEVTLSDRLEFIPLEPEIEEAVRIAFLNRPDLHQAELNLKLQEESWRAARSGYWPDISAFFEQVWANPDPHSSTRIEWGDAWTAGLAAQWPLFDGLGREGRVAREKARIRQRELQLASAEEQALLEVKQVILSLGDAAEFVESQSLNLERAREALRLAEIEYREGIQDAVTVTESRSALTRAEGLYYEAVYYHTVARLELQRALGVLGPRAGAAGSPTPPPTRLGVIEEFVGTGPDPSGSAEGEEK